MFATFQLLTLLLTTPVHAPDVIEHSHAHHQQGKPKFQLVTRTNVPLQGLWTMKPKVVICDGAVRLSRAEQAVQFWERLGYEFESVESSNDPASCHTPDIGVIKIILPSAETNMNNNLAVTKTFRILETSENIRADIMIHSFASRKPLVLEHEIGHALGWYHINKYGHLMNPQYERLGHNTLGYTSSAIL
jgi:hypothetical protein